MNEVQQTWYDLAKKTLEILEEEENKEYGNRIPYENENFAKPLTPERLGKALQKADKSFMWKVVPHAE